MTLMLRQPLPLLDNDVLRTFVAIADTGSFTTAADRVYRTPSAVSMQIKKLEEQLNVTLFLRDARSVTLTEGGEVLLPYARRRDLHKRAADVLSALPGRPDDDRLSLIAHHRDLAGERLLAWEALRRAGDRAARKFAHHEAASLYERAIENALPATASAKAHSVRQ